MASGDAQDRAIHPLPPLKPPRILIWIRIRLGFFILHRAGAEQLTSDIKIKVHG